MKLRPWQFSEPQWAALIVVCALWLLGPGVIEGRLAPAAAPISLDRIVPVSASPDWPGGAVDIWGESARLRPACNFRGIDWYRGARGGRNVPTRVDPGPAIVRADGSFSFGPWRVGVPDASALRFDSFADVRHRCYVGPPWWRFALPWETVSALWR